MVVQMTSLTVCVLIKIKICALGRFGLQAAICTVVHGVLKAVWGYTLGSLSDLNLIWFDLSEWKSEMKHLEAKLLSP